MMDHPNIARVFDAGATETGRPYFVMELVHGIPITEYCNTNKLTTRERLELFLQVCHAVQHAHSKGIIHRDIKPTNVLTTLHDDKAVPKVIDFGVAKAMHQRLTEKTLFTEFRQMIGTPQYMSPEQAQMSGLDIDTRSDVYSLGVLFYELLTGTTPLDAKALRTAAYEQMQKMIQEQDPPAPSTRLSTMGVQLATVAAERRSDPAKLSRLLRGEIDWIVMRSLEKDRTRRYDTASAMARDIERYLADEPVEACPPSARYRLEKFARRYRKPLALAGSIAVLLVAAVAISSWQAIRATRADHQLIRERDRVLDAQLVAEREKALAQAQAARAEDEAHRSRLQYANSLISNADALMATREFPASYARLAEAETILKELGEPYGALNLSLVRLYRLSPPPLWTATIPGGAPKVWTLLAKRKELLLAGNGEDKQFHVLDIISGRELRSFGDARDVKCMASVESPDGPVVVAGSEGFTRIMDVKTGAIVREIQDDRATRACALSPDGKLAASIDAGDAVVFWETDTFKRLGEGRHGIAVDALSFSHDGLMVATVTRQNTIRLWEPRTGKLIREIKGLDGGSECVTFTPDDTGVVCGGKYNGELGFFPVSGAKGTVTSVQSGTIRTVVVTPEGQRVITSGSDGTIRVLDASLTTPGFGGVELGNQNASRMEIGFVPDTGAIACESTKATPPTDQGVVIGVDHNGRAYAWPVRAPVRIGEDSDAGITMTPDGLLCAGRTPAGDAIVVQDTVTGRVLRRARIDNWHWSEANALSADGKYLYTSTFGDDAVQAIELLSGKTLWSVKAHDGSPRSLAISPDGRSLATVGADYTARIWDTRTGKLLRALNDLGEGQVVAFAPVADSGARDSLAPRRTGTCSLVTRAQAWSLIGILVRGAAHDGLMYPAKLAE